LPVITVFCPVEGAVKETALPHCSNNIHKVAKVDRHADNDLVL
jgi:hypothetical protein